MRHPIVIGLQFGDEGKGKFTDYLAQQSEWVIRYNGGSNAGHTLWFGGQKLVTHSVPSGVLYPHVKNFIGAGCVLSPLAFEKEMQELVAAGFDLKPDRLKIDFRVHLTLPIHIQMDAARENAAGQTIGTTRKGIGPTYTHKMERLGIRLGDIFHQDTLNEKLERLCHLGNAYLKTYEMPESSFDENYEMILKARSFLKDYVSWETAPFFEIAKSHKCVIEGAQGIMLDVDHGSFPFVTSSNTLPSHAGVGVPFPMTRLGRVFGIAKVYLTRVGEGPLVSEMNSEDAERIRAKGGEFGATTGRPRRVAWLNLDELKNAVQLSDVDSLILTKADVLAGEPVVRYLVDGAWREVEGWSSVLDDKGALSAPLENFVSTIETHVGAPVLVIGTGPDRKDLVWRGSQNNLWSKD